MVSKKQFNDIWGETRKFRAPKVQVWLIKS